MSKKTFRRELMVLINKHSKENGSNTPDYILAEYLIDCLRTFDKTIKLRTEWYGEGKIEQKIREVHVGMKEGLKNMIFTDDPETIKNNITDTTKFSSIDIDKTFGGEKPGYPSRKNAEL
jgi:hypothetical protein